MKRVIKSFYFCYTHFMRLRTFIVVVGMVFSIYNVSAQSFTLTPPLSDVERALQSRTIPTLKEQAVQLGVPSQGWLESEEHFRKRVQEAARARAAQLAAEEKQRNDFYTLTPAAKKLGRDRLQKLRNLDKKLQPKSFLDIIKETTEKKKLKDNYQSHIEELKRKQILERNRQMENDARVVFSFQQEMDNLYEIYTFPDRDRITDIQDEMQSFIHKYCAVSTSLLCQKFRSLIESLAQERERDLLVNSELDRLKRERANIYHLLIQYQDQWDGILCSDHLSSEEKKEIVSDIRERIHSLEKEFYTDSFLKPEERYDFDRRGLYIPPRRFPTCGIPTPGA